MSLLHFYRIPALSESKKKALLSTVHQKISPEIRDIHTEFCFNIEITDTSAPLTPEELKILQWLLAETFEPENFSVNSFLTLLTSRFTNYHLFEVGPRMNFTTAWSTNAVSVCHACGLHKITRIERSRRYLIETKNELTDEQREDLLKEVHDRMTECLYPETLSTFETGIMPEPVYDVLLIEDGKSALEKINKEMGLGLDEWDMDYYYNLFVQDIGRNPTNVECFDLSQSNSEHSRHWFFKGRLIIDSREVPHSLMEIINNRFKPGQRTVSLHLRTIPAPYRDLIFTQ